MSVASTDGDALVEVCDDGVGGADPLGIRLRGLGERAAALDGELEADSPPGRGTTLRTPALRLVAQVRHRPPPVPVHLAEVELKMLDAAPPRAR